MYRTDSTKRSVELPELCFDGMNISCHKFNDIDALPCIPTDKVFSCNVGRTVKERFSGS